METQKKPKTQKRPNVITNLWTNWCGLDPVHRTQVADRLGAVGHVLSIAANVSNFASNTLSTPEDVTEDTSEHDEDIIDVEYEEVER